LYFKLFFIFFFSISLNANSLIVIVSKDSNIKNISKKELSKIFLSKTKRLPNGEKSIVLEHTSKTNQSEFYKLVCNKNEKQLKKYWTKMIFTGRGQPPKKIKSLEKLIELVQNNKYAISYIPSKYMNSNLKIIMEIK
jgi:ABC-type phosphate transport system substrate-binding protein